ncbi:hypothetical protein B296_00051445 [Ensete ventricosum]|uniref:Uncharacterized protein n=1 Tax=Ensete ventricosum TaxID=4639 RepID=A0A426Y4K2_ENSVE|nr:hypothetical protein B296_00051445 [Ensete ventricosum]
MVCIIPASAWTWLVRSRKASVVTVSGAGFDAGEGNPGLVIILQKRLGVSITAVASSVCRGWSGAGAFIVSVVDHSYLVALLLLWPTMPPYPSTTLAVPVVRRAFAGRGCRPYLCQVGCMTTGAPHTCIRSIARVGSATSVSQLSEGLMT